MNCKSCNTRISRGASNCPNCGLALSSGLSARASEEDSNRLSPSRAHEEIDLDEIATPVEARPKKTSPKAAAEPAPKPKPKAKAPAPSDSESGFGGAPNPDELRAMLGDKLSLLEPGLSVFKQNGKAVGRNFETDLGEIDVLASDDGGGLVVIQIAEPDAKDIVTEMLGRVGWVRKHLSKTGQEVRGIVIAQSMPESAEYTAAAVADTITFKTYQITLSFSNIEI
jgi:hypothetical protein